MNRITILQINLLCILPIFYSGSSNASDRDSAKIVEFGCNFLDCEMDSFINWRSSLQQDQIIYNAYDAYIYRKRIIKILGIGFGSTVGTGLLVAGAMQEKPDWTEKDARIFKYALIFAGVNTFIWAPGFFKFVLFKSKDERLLINEYEKSLPKKTSI